MAAMPIRRAVPADAEELTRLRKVMMASVGFVDEPGWWEACVAAFESGLADESFVAFVADSPHGATGVIIPSAAIVVYAGQSWCFIETAPGKYERRAVALDLPISDGYLVSGGFTTDMRVVVRGASLLLSREAGPGEVDDDDGPAKKPADKDGEAEKPAAEKTSDTQDKPAQPSAVAVDHGASVAPNTDHD